MKTKRCWRSTPALENVTSWWNTGFSDDQYTEPQTDRTDVLLWRNWVIKQTGKSTTHKPGSTATLPRLERAPWLFWRSWSRNTLVLASGFLNFNSTRLHYSNHQAGGLFLTTTRNFYTKLLSTVISRILSPNAISLIIWMLFYNVHNSLWSPQNLGYLGKKQSCRRTDFPQLMKERIHKKELRMFGEK